MNKCEKMNFSPEHIRSALYKMRKPPCTGAGRPASVFLLFYWKKNSPYILTILKTDNQGYPWRNQVAFPGGRRDPSDPTPLAAAFRELNEEIGIEEKDVELICSLGCFPTIFDTEIEAFAGIWNGLGLSEHFDRNEISEIIEIPLQHLVSTHKEHGFSGHTPGIEKLLYPYKHVTIWGVTARILHAVIEALIST